MLGKLTDLFKEETVTIENAEVNETFDDVVIDESFKIEEKETSIPVINRNVVRVYHPVSKNNTSAIINALKRGDLVIVNLSKVAEEEARYIYATLSGSIFSLDGELKMLDSNVMLCAPKQYIVDGDDSQ